VKNNDQNQKTTLLFQFATTTTTSSWNIAIAVLSLIHVVSGHEVEHLDLANWTAQEHWPAGELNCAQGYRRSNKLTQKRTYNIGVYAPDK
jgi:hypothetical protein